MKILTWAAVAATALFVLMNAGAVVEPGIGAPYRVIAAALAVAGAAAAVGLAAGWSWGRAAVVGVGALNVAASTAALVTGQEGAVIGLAVGGLGVVLGALSGGTPRPAAA